MRKPLAILALSLLPLTVHAMMSPYTYDDEGNQCVPNYKGPEQIKGYLCTSIALRSELGKAGVQDGDIIERVNGIVMNTPDRGIEALKNLTMVDHYRISIRRHGRLVTLNK